jgi:hypothetical protein
METKDLNTVAHTLDQILADWYSTVREKFAPRTNIEGITGSFSYDFNDAEYTTIPSLPDEGEEYMSTHNVGTFACVRSFSYSDELLQLKNEGKIETSELYLDDSFISYDDGYLDPDIPEDSIKYNPWIKLTEDNLDLYQRIYDVLSKAHDFKSFSDPSSTAKMVSLNFLPETGASDIPTDKSYAGQVSVIVQWYDNSDVKHSFVFDENTLPSINETWSEDLHNLKNNVLGTDKFYTLFE